MRVLCDVEPCELEGDHGLIESVRVICTRCAHEEESYGTGPASIRRCLALLREDCDESNYYYVEEADDRD